MIKDEILNEIWRHRDAYAEEHHHSLEAMVADLQRRQVEHEDRLVDRRHERRSQEARSA